MIVPFKSLEIGQSFACYGKTWVKTGTKRAESLEKVSISASPLFGRSKQSPQELVLTGRERVQVLGAKPIMAQADEKPDLDYVTFTLDEETGKVTFKPPSCGRVEKDQNVINLFVQTPHHRYLFKFVQNIVYIFRWYDSYWKVLAKSISFVKPNTTHIVINFAIPLLDSWEEPLSLTWGRLP